AADSPPQIQPLYRLPRRPSQSLHQALQPVRPRLLQKGLVNRLQMLHSPLLGRVVGKIRPLEIGLVTLPRSHRIPCLDRAGQSSAPLGPGVIVASGLADDAAAL